MSNVLATQVARWTLRPSFCCRTLVEDCRPLSATTWQRRGECDRYPSLRPVVRLTTSAVCCATRPKNSRKNIIKPVLMKPKSARMQREVVDIRPSMTVAELAEALGRDVGHVFEVMAQINVDTRLYSKPSSVIESLDMMKRLVDISGLRWRIESKKQVEHTEETSSKDVFRRPAAAGSALVRRPPVVTIMGHVDHGKTTLLDALRHSNRVAQEFGGITQHIGAFSVMLSSGEAITFLDTPGHAAFSAMRARGASVTDIVILVVAADDGVMKQTIESIRCAREAGVALIVAINKMDKPGVDLERTKRALIQHQVMLEGHGGDVQAIPISALKGTNLDALQEAIVALAEVLETRADPTGPVEGSVIESRTDPGRGKLSSALVQRGTLQKGCVLVAGTAWAKVRGLFNDRGQPVECATPGTPVEVIGWRELPGAGEEILEVESEQRAKQVVAQRQRQLAELKMTDDADAIRLKADVHRVEYEAARLKRLQAGRRYMRSGLTGPRQKEATSTDTRPQLAVVIKGDVDGSVEAILDVLETYDSAQCRLHILGYGVGAPTEHDVEMAAAFDGLVIGFNVVASEKVLSLARQRHVSIKSHNVIYRLVEEVKDGLALKLPPLDVEEILGEANVQAEFSVTDGKKKVFVAGCRCTKGALLKKKKFKLVRAGTVLLRGELSSLKHFKNEVDTIKMDVECGLSFADQSVSPQPGDTVVCYELRQQKQELNWVLDF